MDPALLDALTSAGPLGIAAIASWRWLAVQLAKIDTRDREVAAIVAKLSERIDSARDDIADTRAAIGDVRTSISDLREAIADARDGIRRDTSRPIRLDARQ